MKAQHALVFLSCLFLSASAAAGSLSAGEEAWGRFISGDYARALALAEPAAKKGDPVALWTLARLYLFGKGVAADKAKADDYHAQALAAAKPAAGKGEPRAEYVLGALYINGLGLTRSDNEAFELWRQAAEQGEVIAQTSLGYAYQSGRWVRRDEAAALPYFRKAAEAGWADAQNELGLCYAHGRGAAKDPKEAVKWYRKAAKQDYPPSENNLGYQYASGQGVDKDEREGACWYRKSAEHGYPLGEYNLCLVYLGGHGVGKDESQASSWCLKAAQAGYVPAQTKLAWMYREGRGLEHDDQKGLEWLRKAAGRADRDAENTLGVLYNNGAGVEKDFKQAVFWYRKAADHGNRVAQYNLGRKYEYGQGVEKDPAAAVDWYRKSAAQGYAPKYKKGDLWDKALASLPKGAASVKKAEGDEEQQGGLWREEVEKLMDQAVERAVEKTAAQPEKPAPAAARSDVDQTALHLPERPDDFAVVVGVESYANDLPKAEFAERDAEAVKAHLIGLGYPERNIKLLTGSRATKGNLEAYVEDWLPRNVKEGGRVFFYFSGHGAPDPASNQAFLVPADGDPSFLEKTAYPVKKLYASLGALKAKEVFVALDSCFSGAGGRSVLASGARPLVTTVDAAVAPGGKLTLFAAAAPKEITATLKDQGHGIFTYYFLKGLDGAAKDKSGSVTAKALFEYLKPKVQDAASRQNRDQTPMLQGPSSAALVEAGR